ncbi:MAG: class I SAM-dependent methyltransferase [Deltaproteobacteria bacterium]|nr:class I SAM-dependent methyltransferase [Deltaproteobacteria bacterium]
MLDVDDLFLGRRLEITSIDPDPSRLRARMRPGDEQRVRILQQPVQDVPLDLYDRLEAHDSLFIDSTHVLNTGSDVNHLLFHVLPRLAPGVWVHVHDVAYPFEYPREWVAEGRAWNEAYAWRALLQYDAAFDVQVMNTCLEFLEPDWFRDNMPLCLKNVGGSLWLRRRCPPAPLGHGGKPAAVEFPELRPPPRPARLARGNGSCCRKLAARPRGGSGSGRVPCEPVRSSGSSTHGRHSTTSRPCSGPPTGPSTTRSSPRCGDATRRGFSTSAAAPGS